MIRDLKVLGLALAAMLALGAVAASAASAQNGMLTSDGPVTLTGEESGAEPGYVEAFGLKAQCPGSTGTGHKVLTQTETEEGRQHELVPSGATTFTGTPHIKEVTAGGKMNCKAAGSFPMTTDFNGCDYVVHVGETTAVDTYKGTTDIVCPPGKEIVWTIFTTEAEDPSTPFCTLHVKPQNGLSGATAVDTTNGTIQVSGTGTGIHVTRTNHGAHALLCPNNTTTNSAKITGQALVTGHDENGEPTDIGLSHN